MDGGGGLREGGIRVFLVGGIEPAAIHEGGRGQGGQMFVYFPPKSHHPLWAWNK